MSNFFSLSPAGEGQGEGLKVFFIFFSHPTSNTFTLPLIPSLKGGEKGK